MSKPMASVVERSVILTRAFGMHRARSGEDGVRSIRVTGAPRTCTRWARVRLPPSSPDEANAVVPVVAAIAAAVSRVRVLRFIECLRRGWAYGVQGRRRAPVIPLCAHPHVGGEVPELAGLRAQQQQREAERRRAVRQRAAVAD